MIVVLEENDDVTLSENVTSSPETGAKAKLHSTSNPSTCNVGGLSSADVLYEINSLGG